MLEFPIDIGTSLFDDDVRAALTRIQRFGLRSQPIAFYGSSSFRFWTTLAMDLGVGADDVANLGFGGGTNASGLHYADRLVVAAQPSKIVLYFGENDIAADGLSARSTFDAFKRLRDHLAKALKGVPVFFLSTKQSPARWIYADEVTRYNDLAREYCEGDSQTYFVDVTSALLGEHGRPTGKYFNDDSIHLNASGYGIWADILRAELGLAARTGIPA